MINYNYLYILSIIIFGGWLFIGAALLYIYEKMGVKRNWIALIPFLGYKPLFDYVGISYWTMLVIFIPKVGTDIFMFLISFILFKFAEKTRQKPFFTMGILLLPEVFLLIMAFKKDVNYNYISELDLLESQILELEKEEELLVDKDNKDKHN